MWQLVGRVSRKEKEIQDMGLNAEGLGGLSALFEAGARWYSQGEQVASRQGRGRRSR